MKNSTFSFSGMDVPRNIPGGLKARILFANPVTLLGLVFLCFDLVFSLVFIPSMELKKSLAFSETDPLAKGIITAKEETNTRVNKRNVFEYHFTYKLPNGKTYTGHSYSSVLNAQKGDSAIVQYVEKTPGISILQGTNAGTMPLAMAPFLLIFPLVGLVLFVIGILRGKKNLHLVKNGIFTHGKVTHKEPTSSRVNKQTVYKVHFEFKTQDGNTHTAFVRTHKPHNLGDEEKEPLVYDAAKPANATLLDSLPKPVRKFFEGF